MISRRWSALASATASALQTILLPANGDVFFRQDAVFSGATASCMLNDRVEDLDGLRLALREAGGDVLDNIQESDHGKFAGGVDREGNRGELGRPPVGS